MPKEFLLILAFTGIIVRGLIISIRYCLLGTCLEYQPYMFIMFASIIPITIAYCLLHNIIRDCWIIGIIDVRLIFLLTLSHLINSKNYNLSNIKVSSLLLIVYTFIPLFDLLWNIEFFSPVINRDINFPKSTVNPHLFSVYSYDDISYPNGHFRGEITLNVQVSKRFNQLTSNGGVTVPKHTGAGKVYDCRVIYNGDDWVRTNNGFFYKEAYVKSAFTRSINNFMSPIVDLDFKFDLGPKNYLLNPGVLSKLIYMLKDPTEEYRVDGFVATLMPHFFGIDRGYGYNPQFLLKDQDTYMDGKIDFMVDYNNIPVLMIEDKTASKSADSWLDLLGQGKNYAKNNPNFDVVFLMVIKGAQAAFFMYDEDWHSNKGLDLKCEAYQDLIGLQVTSEGISLLPQLNTYHPQVKIYNIGVDASPSNILAVTTMVTYI